MPYLAVNFHRGATEDQWRATAAASGGLPHGCTYLAAGPTDDGILISTVWDSQESYRRFLDSLQPWWPAEDGLQDRPEWSRGAEVVDLMTTD